MPIIDIEDNTYFDDIEAGISVDENGVVQSITIKQAGYPIGQMTLMSAGNGVGKSMYGLPPEIADLDKRRTFFDIKRMAEDKHFTEYQIFLFFTSNLQESIALWANSTMWPVELYNDNLSLGNITFKRVSFDKDQRRGFYKADHPAYERSLLVLINDLQTIENV